jgi:1,4-dihydroxy-2-naphthoate octaprenyltransferase
MSMAVTVLVGAVLAHASVNLLNEYMDFKSGLDFKTLRTPFSGGSGALVADPAAAKGVLFLGVLTLSVVAVIGLYIVLERGVAILPIGLLGLAVVAAYTPWINRNPWLCLIAPGTGIGPLMVGGTYVALTGHYASEPFVISLVPFFLVNNLLLLNQYPDVSVDREAGRNHAPIALGIGASNRIYLLFALLAGVSLVGGVATGALPVLGLTALAPLLLVLPVYTAMRRYRGDAGTLLTAMGLNVAASVLSPLLLAVALFVD